MPPTLRQLRVFLCHASQDKVAVRELQQRFADEGWIDPWLDEKKLHPGEDWRMSIEEAVESSDLVVICLSNNSVDKEGFVQKELRYAREIALEKPEGTIFLIPLRLEECDVPRGLRFFQWTDYFGSKKEQNYTDLLESFSIRRQQAIRREEEKARKEAEEKEKREKEEKARKEAEELAKKEAEEEVRRQAEAKALKEEEDRARAIALESAKKEAFEKALEAAREKARLEAELQARKDIERHRQESETSPGLTSKKTAIKYLPLSILVAVFLVGIGLILGIGLVGLGQLGIGPLAKEAPPTGFSEPATLIPTGLSTIELTTPAPNPTMTNLSQTNTPAPKPTQIVSSDIFSDDFTANTLDRYEYRGTIIWDASKQAIKTDGVPNGDSAMYIPVVVESSFTATGRVFVPNTGIGRYDSIALALKGDEIEYWGILLYGNSLVEKNNISISRNDRQWGNLYPKILTSGWYTIKLYIDQDKKRIYCKAWADGDSEPDWQVEANLDSNWILRAVGFRHAGDGSSWMDDLSVSQTITK